MQRFSRISVVLAAFLPGCHQSLEPEGDKISSPVNSDESSPVKQFYIGDTDFGIDTATSSFTIDASSGVATARVESEDIDNYEFSIYTMEHNNLDDLNVRIVPDKCLEVTGHVDLFGDLHDFAIHRER